MNDPMYPNVPTKPISTTKQKRLDVERIQRENLEVEESTFRKTYYETIFAVLHRLSYFYEYYVTVIIVPEGFNLQYPSDSFKTNIHLPHTLDVNTDVVSLKSRIDSIVWDLESIDVGIRVAAELQEKKDSAWKKMEEVMTPEELKLLGIL